jgi:Sulfite exporter TauE/SafE
MGLSPYKRCSLDFGSEHHGSEPRSQHLHHFVSQRHVSRRAACRAWRLRLRNRCGSGLALHTHTAADRNLDHGSWPCCAGLFSLEIAACVELATTGVTPCWNHIGVPLGVFTLARADPHYLRLGTGAVLVLFSLYGLLRPTITPIKAGALAGDLGAGFLNGVLGGATGLAGIVTVIWCQLRGWTKDQQRAVFQPVGVATFAMSVAWLGGQGSVSRDVIRLFVIALPVVLLGTWLGLKFYGRLDEAQFRKLVLILLLASGAVLLFP